MMPITFISTFAQVKILISNVLILVQATFSVVYVLDLGDKRGCDESTRLGPMKLR